MRKVTQGMLLFLFLLSLAGCTMSSSEDADLAQGKIAPTVLTESAQDVFDAFGMRDTSQMLSFNAPAEMCIRDSRYTTIQLICKESTGTDKPFPFEDVQPGTWYYETVKKAYQLGLIDGLTETTSVSYTHLDVYKRQGLSQTD